MSDTTLETVKLQVLENGVKKTDHIITQKNKQ